MHSLQMCGLLPAMVLIASYNPVCHFDELQTALGEVSLLSHALVPLSAALSAGFLVALACQAITCALQSWHCNCPGLSVCCLCNPFLETISGESAAALTTLHTGNLSFSSGKLSRLCCGWVRNYCTRSPHCFLRNAGNLRWFWDRLRSYFPPSGVSDPANICSKIPFQVVPPVRTAAMAGAGTVRWAHAQIFGASRRFVC